MPLLFSYGTLQVPTVQIATFGRTLLGTTDGLPGYKLARVKIDDGERAASLGRTHNANAVMCSDGSSRIAGTALEVRDEELLAADEYERADGYARIEVVLASGRRAWLYVSKATAR